MHLSQIFWMRPSEIFLDAPISNILDAYFCKSAGEALCTSLPCGVGWDQGKMRKKYKNVKIKYKYKLINKAPIIYNYYDIIIIIITII